METIFGILIAVIPCVITYFSMRSNQRTLKINDIASEQLQKDYLPLHKKLSLFSPTNVDDYKAIEEFVEDLFLNEYLLIDEASKSKFEAFSSALKSQNEFKIGVEYESFYNAVDFYFNDLKKRLGYPYKFDWKALRFQYRYNLRFRNNAIFTFGFLFVLVISSIRHFFDVSENNTVILREHTVQEQYGYLIYILVLNFIFWIVTKLKR